MAQSERWQKIGREILFSARTELYMSLPFLDTALAALTVSDGYDTATRGSPSSTSARAQMCAAHTCTRCSTVCCGIPPRRAAATERCGILPAT